MIIGYYASYEECDAVQFNQLNLKRFFPIGLFGATHKSGVGGVGGGYIAATSRFHV